MSDFSKVKYKKQRLLSKNVTDRVPRSQAAGLCPTFASLIEQALVNWLILLYNYVNQFQVKINYKDDTVREEVISLYQTVAQFKSLLHQWFRVPPQNMRLYYCDQVMVKLSGPEEMKWPNKALYTYNVQDGDRFILDEKVPLTKLRTNSGTSLSRYSYIFVLFFATSLNSYNSF